MLMVAIEIPLAPIDEGPTNPLQQEWVIVRSIALVLKRSVREQVRDLAFTLNEDGMLIIRGATPHHQTRDAVHDAVLKVISKDCIVDEILIG